MTRLPLLHLRADGGAGAVRSGGRGFVGGTLSDASPALAPAAGQQQGEADADGAKHGLLPARKRAADKSTKAAFAASTAEGGCPTSSDGLKSAHRVGSSHS